MNLKNKTEDLLVCYLVHQVKVYQVIFQQVKGLIEQEDLNKPRFSGVYSRYNLPDKIKDGAYVINLDEYFDIGTH